MITGGAPSSGMRPATMGTATPSKLSVTATIESRGSIVSTTKRTVGDTSAAPASVANIASSFRSVWVASEWSTKSGASWRATDRSPLAR